MARLHELLDLTGRGALLVGGGSAIALGFGEALVEQGARVVILDVDEARGQRRCAVLDGHCGRPGAATFLLCDLADETATREAVHETFRRLGRLDILVHTAAFTGETRLKGWAVPFGKQTVEAWDLAMRVNLTSAFVLAQEAAPYLTASPGGSIVLVSSIYGQWAPDWSLYEGTTMGNPAGYNAAKAGLIQLARYLATTLAPVRANVISPGGIERGQPSSFKARYCARTPLGRMGREEDLKGSLAFLASDASAYVTGQNLVVDGGWGAW